MPAPFRPAQAVHADGGSWRSGAEPSLASDGRTPRPRTLVDAVIDALIDAAARGRIFPGDRVVEAEVAQTLGVSRVPVREALRLLESQGVVSSEPFKGIRLMPFTPERLDDLIEARVALETTAAARAIRAGRNGEGELAQLTRLLDDLEGAARRGDAYALAEADIRFHRALLSFSRNDVVCALWEGLARQATIVFGLSTLGKPMPAIVDEHRALLAVFRQGSVEAMSVAMDDHIGAQTHAVDFAGIIARLRARRDPRAERDGTARVRRSPLLKDSRE